MLVATRAAARDDGRADGDGAAPTTAHLILGALILIGGVLRFATLGSQSFWFDEAQTAHEVSLGFGSLISSLTTHETNPPLYFVLGWVWARVFGTSEVALRSISALAGVALIPLAYACGRELVSRRAGLLTAALVAVNPFLIWYSQEAREYMLLAALSAAALLWFTRALRDGSPRSVVVWAVFAALCLLTHFFAAFLVWPQAAWLLVRHRRWIVAAACAGLLAVQAALLPFAVTHATHSLLGFVGTTPLIMRVRQVPVSFALGRLDESGIVQYGWIVATVVLAVVIALLVAGATRRELEGAGIAAALAACGIVLPLVAALLGEDFLISRALIAAWVPLAVVIAAACTTRGASAAGWGLAGVLLALFVFGHVRVTGSPAYQRPDWRGVARALGPARGRRAIVVYDGGLATDPLRVYLPGIPWSGPTPAGASVAELDVVGSAIDSVAHPLPAGATLLADRVLDGFRVVRFRIPVSVGASAATAGRLLSPAAPGAAVLVQSSG